MNSQPLLTIGIPTYNRAEKLKKGLENILRQRQQANLVSDVEIVVSDNASTDSTEEVVKSFTADNLKYFRNPQNLLFDRNVANILRKSAGKFCWTLSDDEQLAENALPYVFGILKENQDLVYICIDGSGNLTDSTVFLDHGGDWLKKYGLIGGLVSLNIFNLEYLPKDLEKYYDNWWIHFSLAFETRIKGRSALVKNVFVTQREEKLARWAKGGNNFTTYFNIKRILENSVKFGYDKNLIGEMVSGLAKGLPRVIASAKLQGLKVSFKTLRLLISEFYQYPIWLLATLFVFFTPTFLLSFFKSIFIKIFPSRFKNLI